ncbi:hypothetical protein CCR75_007543 [Bremia lactucae]|uniref:Uncharacterized protein n=1 Tax=Bremia lactucae TaxID=4779 RepID=A0A976FGZ7_BRELC|nr:hypothetical protein CCR75_007543 [Bremia lactucae]
MDKVPLDKVWSYVCNDGKYAPTDEEVKIFSRLYGYVVLLSSNNKKSEGSTNIVELKLAQAYRVNKNILARDMLFQIRLARQYTMSGELFKLPEPSSFPLQTALLKFEENCQKHDSKHSVKKDRIKFLRLIFPDDSYMADTFIKGIKNGIKRPDEEAFATFQILLSGHTVTTVAAP